MGVGTGAEWTFPEKRLGEPEWNPELGGGGVKERSLRGKSGSEEDRAFSGEVWTLENSNIEPYVMQPFCVIPENLQ